MTQQTTQASVMSVTEFDEHHYRTGQYIARVGKLWAQIAEEQQAIIDGQGYVHLGYGSYQGYWEGEFKEQTGWSYQTIDKWLVARRNKGKTPFVGADEEVPLYDRLGPSHWVDLGSIEDPEQRAEFLRRYEPEIKPKLKAEGVSSRIFRESIKEFKGERPAPVLSEDVREIMEDLPSGTLSREHKWMFRLTEIQSALDRLDPHDVAQHSLSNTKLIAHYSDRAQDTIDWLSKYIEELDKLQGTTLRVVSGGNA